MGDADIFTAECLDFKLVVHGYRKGAVTENVKI